MSAKQCVTHHHACDCREAMFKELLEVAKDTLKTLESQADETFGIDNSDEIETLKAAIAKVEGKNENRD